MLIRNGAEVAGRRADLRIGEDASSRSPRPSPARVRPSSTPKAAPCSAVCTTTICIFSPSRRGDSIDCGPPRVETRAELERDRPGPPDDTGWLRGADYFESVAGDLDRDALDALCPDRPLRIPTPQRGALDAQLGGALAHRPWRIPDPDPTPAMA
ncbi:MAG: hypothetical protein R3E53_09955 [Myxococcota bacterium]